AIRSMENRLARQGLLAAPETILSSGKQGKQEWGLFYDLHDNFIDDTELEAVNAYHTQKQQKQKTGGRVDATKRAELDLPRPAEATTQEEQAFLAGFRLTGGEVSGTSDESSCESDGQNFEDVGLRGNPWRREARGWHWQLSELQQELILVDSKPSLASPKEGEISNSELTEEACLNRIKAVLTEFCSTVGDSAGRSALCAPEKMEEAVGNLWRRLPPLLRVPLKPEEATAGYISGGYSRRFKRFQLKNLEPKLQQQRKMSSPELNTLDDHVDPLAWSAAEEFAWCCFCWRLLSSTSPTLRRARFTRQWLNAVRGPQEEAFELARSELAARVQKAISAHESNVSTGKAKDMSGASWVEKALKKGALSWPAMALQALWLRKMLWQEQRQRKKVHAVFPDSHSDFSSRKSEVIKAQQTALTHFIRNQFELLSLKLNKEILAKAMGYRTQAIAKAQGRQPKKEELKKEEASKPAKSKPAVQPEGKFTVGQWVEVLRHHKERPGFGRNAVVEALPEVQQGSVKEVQVRTPDGEMEVVSIKKLRSAHLWKQGERVEAKIEGTWLEANIAADMPKEADATSKTPVAVVLVNGQAATTTKATVDFQHVRRFVAARSRDIIQVN
ncbi:unnamed protein product, partial [Symbiodinium pilosum]